MSVKTLTIESIHFGSVPTLLESPAVLWLQFRFPPPGDLQVNEKVAVLDCDSRVLGTFYIDDVVGTRVILTPLNSECLRPVRECDVFITKYTREHGHPTAGWSARVNEIAPGIKDWLYGTGTSATQLAYIGV